MGKRTFLVIGLSLFRWLSYRTPFTKKNSKIVPGGRLNDLFYKKNSKNAPPEGDLVAPFTKKTQKLPPEGDLMTPFTR